MPWGKRIFYRSTSSTPSGPALDLLAPKQAFDESGSPTTTTTEDGTPVSDDEEEDETDNEGLSQSATKRLGQRFCVLAGLVATLLLVLGCIRIAVAYNRAEVAADALIRSFTGGIDEQPITWLEDADKRMSMAYEDYRKRRGRRRRPRDDGETDYALSKPDDLDDELLQRAGRGPATAQHDKERSQMDQR